MYSNKLYCRSGITSTKYTIYRDRVRVDEIEPLEPLGVYKVTRVTFPRGTIVMEQDHDTVRVHIRESVTELPDALRCESNIYIVCIEDQTARASEARMLLSEFMSADEIHDQEILLCKPPFLT